MTGSALQNTRFIAESLVAEVSNEEITYFVYSKIRVYQITWKIALMSFNISVKFLSFQKTKMNASTSLLANFLRKGMDAFHIHPVIEYD